VSIGGYPESQKKKGLTVARRFSVQVRGEREGGIQTRMDRTRGGADQSNESQRSRKKKGRKKKGELGYKPSKLEATGLNEKKGRKKRGGGSGIKEADPRKQLRSIQQDTIIQGKAETTRGGEKKGTIKKQENTTTIEGCEGGRVDRTEEP